MNKPEVKAMSDMEEELCEHCPLTDFGFIKVNTGPHNLCEGARCEDAYKNYLESLPEANPGPEGVKK